jgi:hypothetical protein
LRAGGDMFQFASRAKLPNFFRLGRTVVIMPMGKPNLTPDSIICRRQNRNRSLCERELGHACSLAGMMVAANERRRRNGFASIVQVPCELLRNRRPHISACHLFRQTQIQDIEQCRRNITQ